MGKNIVSKGKTAKAAVRIALDLLNAHKDEVEIEIIEPEKRGILGLGSKPAVVRVTVKERKNDNSVEVPLVSFEVLEQASESLDLPKDTSQSDEVSDDTVSETLDDLAGKVWVSEGHIFCKDAPDKFPLVSPGKGMKLYKNSELVEKTVVICENDVLHVEMLDEVREPKWELTISQDRLEALLKVTPGMRIHRRLKDASPNHFIQLEVMEEKVFIGIDTGLIIDKLKEMGVVHGVNYSEIARACTSQEAGSFVIAKGTPPKPGSHGYFLSMQEVEIKKRLKEREDGTIDYREIQEFPSVERGQVLGVVQPPVPGMPGTSVTNELVFPPEVYPLVLQEGKGVVLVENGTKVVATNPGHPVIQVKGQLAKISVIPTLKLNKDIDIQTGNVHYVGDVDIFGSVQDGMLVEAQGNITIRDNINRAKVFAGTSLIVQNNVISSEVTAGKNNLLKAEISLILGELIEHMKRMVEAIHQLSSASAFKVSSFTRTGLGPLIKILCSGKFKSFPSLTTSLVNKIKSGTGVLSEEWFEFAERLQKGFINSKLSLSDFRSVEDVQKVIKMAEELCRSIQESDQDETCFMKVGFAHNSQMYSSGDISVEMGVYNSKLHAGKFIEVNGFVRGGEVYASKGIKIFEAGSRGGVLTKISVPKDGTIKIGSAIEDTVIQVGQKIHTFTVKTSNVFARLNQDGELLIS